MLSSISMNVGSSEPLVDGIQPLSSNVINKQPSTMDAQYMQQQSQVFVFSTALANKSAEAVIQGHYPSIIAYHYAQPKTKKFLEVGIRVTCSLSFKFIDIVIENYVGFCARVRALARLSMLQFWRVYSGSQITYVFYLCVEKFYENQSIPSTKSGPVVE